MIINVAAVFVLFVGSICSGAKLPLNYKRCERKAADVNHCLVQAFQGILDGFNKPIPEIGLPLMDPLFIARMKIGAGTGSVAVNQDYKNVSVTGYKDSKINELKFDFDKKIMEYELIVPDLRMSAEYEVSGKVMLLPIEGNGPFMAIMENCVVRMSSPFEIVEKKDKQFLSFKNSKLIMSPSHVTYSYENLFNGNKELSDNINKVLNDNWKEIYVEVEADFEEAYGAIFEGIANSVFGRVPLSEIFSD